MTNERTGWRDQSLSERPPFPVSTMLQHLKRFRDGRMA
jgi:hypothetical protein